MRITFPLLIYLSLVSGVMLCSSFKEIVDSLDPLPGWHATVVIEYIRKNYQFKELMPLGQLVGECHELSNSLHGFFNDTREKRFNLIDTFISTRFSNFPKQVVVYFDLDKTY